MKEVALLLGELAENAPLQIDDINPGLLTTKQVIKTHCYVSVELNYFFIRQKWLLVIKLRLIVNIVFKKWDLSWKVKKDSFYLLSQVELLQYGNPSNEDICELNLEQCKWA